jgi:uncharacterized protein (TIGR02270 family)
MSLPIMWDIYEEHLSEAAFLWSQWERALVAPDYTLSEVAELEERLLAHLDGLVLGGPPVAESILMPALADDEPTTVSAAAWALTGGGGAKEAAQLVELIVSGKPEQRAAIGRALEVDSTQEPLKALLPLLGAADAAVQAMACDVLSFRAALPQEALPGLLVNPDPGVQCAAIWAWRAFGALDSRPIRNALASSDPEVRNAAIQTGLILGIRAAWERCRQIVETGAPDGRLAMVLLAIGGTDKELGLLLDRLQAPESRADAVWALGFSGRRQAADACFELMANEELAALAGEAFSTITGLELEGEYATERPEEGGEEDLDADLTPRPEDALPLPNREAIARWWQEARKGFEPHKRYLSGKPFDSGALVEALEQGPMRRRHLLALELAIRSRGAHDLATRALTERQRSELAKARSATSLWMKPLGDMRAT